MNENRVTQMPNAATIQSSTIDIHQRTFERSNLTIDTVEPKELRVGQTAIRKIWCELFG